MTADPTVLDRIFDRLARTLSAGGPDHFSAPFTVAEIVQSLVPYRTYRNELGVDTLQDYEHALLELLAGERGWLVCDPDTVAVIRQELMSPDPDTGLLRRLQTVEVRMGAVRMPVANVRPPIARANDDPPAEARPVVSDAVAIGAVMDREDAERAGRDASSRENVAVSATSAKATKKSRRTPRASAVITPEPSAPVAPAANGPASAAVPAVAAATPLPSVADLPTIVPAIAPVDPASTSLHDAKGVTIASAQTLARITPLSVPSVYGDPIDFRGVRHAPVDIGGVIFLFGMVARELGFHVEAMASGFPRCEAKRQLSAGKWARLRIDFEHESRQFRDAGRNPSACDLIVCWRDTWPDRPSSLDVLALDRILPTLAKE